jgi:hypothetical protein
VVEGLLVFCCRPFGMVAATSTCLTTTFARSTPFSSSSSYVRNTFITRIETNIEIEQIWFQGYLLGLVVVIERSSTIIKTGYIVLTCVCSILLQLLRHAVVIAVSCR